MADTVAIVAAANAGGVAPGVVFDSRQIAGGSQVQTVLGGPRGVQTREWHFTAAQSNLGLVTVGTGTQIVVTRATVTLSSGATVAVDVRLGMAASTLTAVTANSATGVGGIFLSHPGIVQGSGVQEGNGSGVLVEGADGEDIRLTCGAPTNGVLRVVITYFTKTT